MSEWSADVDSGGSADGPDRDLFRPKSGPTALLGHDPRDHGGLMTNPTDPLRQEHRQIRARLSTLRVLADNVDEMPAAEASRELRSALAFLEDGLLPHALAEDGVLYPAVALAMGASQATATMSRDHLEIARLVGQLRHLSQRFRANATKRVRRDLRRVLYSLYAVVSLHLDKEDEVYLPLLDGYLSDESARELFAEVEHAMHTPRRAS
ncbi:MAG TPA: hemerythrin domain-containing protein [Acidimicrobiales bacterium]